MNTDKEKPTILYVDDEKSNLDVFVSTFRRYYNIITASSGQEAIDILRRQSVALIIVDQRMPNMTGVEFFETIIPEYPDPIRILLSGYSDADAVIKAINNGRVFRYITKPWDEKELRQSIDVGVKIFQLEKKNRAHINQMHEESIKKERILSLFRKYVPEHVADDAATKSNETLFGGESRDVCILFTLINDLNKHIKNMDPQKVLDFLNKYFSVMSTCIEEHKGTVDKFIGDKILAIFGAPLSDFDNQKNAVFCGLNMLEELKHFNSQYAKEFGFETTISIGINSGNAIVGNIGSQQYISYTSVGDTVTQAAQILEVAKETPSTILINTPPKDNVIIEPLGEKQLFANEKMTLYKIVGKKN